MIAFRATTPGRSAPGAGPLLIAADFGEGGGGIAVGGGDEYAEAADAQGCRENVDSAPGAVVFDSLHFVPEAVAGIEFNGVVFRDLSRGGEAGLDVGFG